MSLWSYKKVIYSMDISFVELLVALYPWIIVIKSIDQRKEGKMYSPFSREGLNLQPFKFTVLQRMKPM